MKFKLKSKKIDEAIVKEENRMYDFQLKNDKNSVGALEPHLIEDKGFKESVKNISKRSFR